jgi:hypothetical protein
MRGPDHETVPAPPLAPEARLEALLDAEEDAAKRADVELLLAIQAEKQELVGRLAESCPDPAVCRDLARRAGANLPLLRQLVALHRGLLGPDAPLYGPAGTLEGASLNARVAGRL